MSPCKIPLKSRALRYQGDIYRQYLKGALILSSDLLGPMILINVAAGLIAGNNGIGLLVLSALVVAMALPAVSFTALIMMSFSSLQKQRVGSNQPLGISIGVFLIMPAYIIPLVRPSLALTVDFFISGLIVFLAIIMHFL